MKKLAVLPVPEPRLLPKKQASSGPLQEPGTPLEPATRAAMESRFGHDFGRVRVHSDSKAAQSAAALKARAFTVGDHIVLGQGKSGLESAAGQRLLAHELAHVVQQSRGGPAPALSRSAPHERDADAVASAVAAGQARVEVAASTGIGLARQGDEEVQLPDLTDKNPMDDPRYIDNLFEKVFWQFAINGAFRFEWTENGKPKALAIAQTDLEQADAHFFAGLTKIHDTREEALKTVALYRQATPGFDFFSFYRREGVILPTVFSLQSTPHFHATWPALKRDAAATAEDAIQGLNPLANQVNPIPGTQVDEHGNLSASGNPFDWMPFFRVKRPKGAKPGRIRFHSGSGVKYKVIGPTHKLKGTCVYVLRDAEGTVLYVGKGDVLDRLRKHIKDINKTQWVAEIDRVAVHGTDLTNTQALALEEDLISQLNPLYNVERTPFRLEFGNAMDLGANLPKGQRVFLLGIEWGH